MPNWCSTVIEIVGPEDEIKKFYGSLKVTTNEDGMKDIRIVESFIPVPEELKITSTIAFEEIPEKWAEWVKDGTWTQEEYDKRVSENTELLEKQRENIAKYGCKDWYEWQYNTWGTKWGDCHTDLVEPFQTDRGWVVTGRFETPWGPADKAFDHISTLFPNCMFMFEFDEEAGFFAGEVIIKNGELIFDEMYEPCDYPEDIDWDDEGSMEKFYEWRRKHEDAIHKSKQKFLASL